MDKIKIKEVILGKNGYDSIVSEDMQICIPTGTNVYEYIGKNVNISFGKDLKITEVKN